MSRRVAVIGAGWSGLACALELTARDLAVSLFDAAPQPGGRARAVAVTLGDREYSLDNGQHLLIGGYRETLRLMQRVGVEPDTALLRLPFELRYPDGFLLRAHRLPAPLHLAAALLGARRLGWAERRQLIGFVRHWRARRWRIDADRPASTLFERAPAEIVRRFWRPLCLAALNVELHQASAQVLLNVLRDSLAASPRAADLLIPRRDLTQVFAGPALAMLQRGGVDARLRSPVQRVDRADSRWRVDGRGSSDVVDAIVLALPPQRAADLLATTRQAGLVPAIDALRAIDTSPIATVYLRYPSSLRLPWPASALLDEPATGRFGQWVFDRGQLDATNAGVLSVVISAAGNALATDASALTASVAQQLSADLALPPPLAGAVLVEKRATIVPAPRLLRPPARLAAPGLYLAGDSADGDYPSTLEGSVRAGIAAAQAIAGDFAAG